jgi:hypothetical protein
MPKPTLRERFEQALKERGATEVKRTFRYHVFDWPAFNDLRNTEVFWYLGKNGSLRYGKTIAGSVPASDKFKADLLGNV